MKINIQGHPGGHLLSVAGSWGSTSFGAPAARWVKSLTVSHFMATLRRHTYDDNPYARVRQHTLIMGPRSTRKTSTAMAFLSDIAGATSQMAGKWYRSMNLATREFGSNQMTPLSAVRAEARRRWRESYIEGDDITAPPDLDEHWLTMAMPLAYDLGSGTSWEKLRGSVDLSGRIIPPPLAYADYVLIPELFEVLDPNPDMAAKKALNLGRSLEEANIVVDLVKAAGLDPDTEAYDANVITAHRYGISVNPETGMFDYRTLMTAIACTIPFDQMKYDVLYDWGFVSRWHLSPYEASPRALLDGMRKPFGIPNEWTTARVRRICISAWLSEWKKVDQPPKATRDAIDRIIAETAEEAFDRLGTHPDLFITTRERNDMVRMATFGAMVRILSEAKRPYEGELVYTAEDAEFAAGYAAHVCTDKFINAMGDVNRSREDHSEADWETLLAYVESSAEEDNLGDIQPSSVFDIEAFVSWFVKGGERTRTDGYKTLFRLERNGWLRSSEWGYKQVSLDGDALRHFAPSE